MEVSVSNDSPLDWRSFVMTEANFNLEQLRLGAVLIFDKPFSWSSFKLVKKVKYLCKANRVGHAGTLDPLATGLMVICTGKCTKMIESLQAIDKTYTGQFNFGKSTPSHDLETEFDHTYPYEHIQEQDIQSLVQSTIGVVYQTPPVYSAIKVNGTRAYKMARQGKTVEIKSRPISIYDFKVSGSLPELQFEVRCSKGTYIRTLTDDFAKQLQSGAYLTELRRTAIGELKIEHAWHLEKFEALCRRES